MGFLAAKFNCQITSDVNQYGLIGKQSNFGMKNGNVDVIYFIFDETYGVYDRR